MFTAEIVLGFLVALALALWLGFDPRLLLTLPPLDLLARLGRAGQFLAEYLAYLELFAAYQLGLHALLAAVDALRDPPSTGAVWRALAQGRDDTNLRPLAWCVLFGAPLAAILVLRLGTHDQPRFLCIASLLTLAAAHTLRPFRFGDFWRGLRTLGATLREQTRHPEQRPRAPDVPPTPVPAPAPRPPILLGHEADWVEAAPRGPRGA
jgi:hypothetical protein